MKSTQRALVLAPHPDDESLGCGGTLRLITLGGGHVDVLYMTSGEKGFFPGVTPTIEEQQAMAQRRQAEARQACRILGARNVAFLNGQDGQIQNQPELADPIAAALEAHDYRSVFCPWPYDGHCDHEATYGFLLNALARHQQDLDIFLYEIWRPLPANMYISIDQTVETKFEAFGAHQSQAALLNYRTGFDGLARYRGLFCPPAHYAEAFFHCERSMLLKHEDLPWRNLR